MTSTSRRSPTLRRRRLEAEIRRLRVEVAEMTSTDVAKTLGWSQGKLSKMEDGQWLRPNPRDIDDLCRLYGVDDATRSALVELAKGSREMDGWWYEHRAEIPAMYSRYIGYEAGASEQDVFDPLVISGMLQTEAYAREVIAASAELTREDVEIRVKIRAKRQRVLDSQRLWTVLHEAALRTEVGNAEVMRAQLHYLLEMAEHAGVTIQVMPFSAGAHAGMNGRFTILSFPEPEDPDAAYIEDPADQRFVDRPEEVSKFKVAFQHLQAKALSPEDSLRMIAEMAQ